jgi:hypothetical protein
MLLFVGLGVMQSAGGTAVQNVTGNTDIRDEQRFSEYSPSPFTKYLAMRSIESFDKSNPQPLRGGSVVNTQSAVKFKYTFRVCAQTGSE